jgi:hypothetical protein
MVEIDEDELRQYQAVFEAIRACLKNPRARAHVIEAQAILDLEYPLRPPQPDVMAIVREMARGE